MITKLRDYTELKGMIRELLFTGKSIVYNPDNLAIDTAMMFGFVKVEDHTVRIANRIFETRLYNLFLSESALMEDDLYKASLDEKAGFIQNGKLHMEQVLERFVLRI